MRAARTPYPLLALLLVGFVVSDAAAVITPTSNALELARAISHDPELVVGASFVTVPTSAAHPPNALSTTPLAGFPTDPLPLPADSVPYVILTNGDPLLADQPNSSTQSGVQLGGGLVPGRGDTAFDVTILKIDLAVPAGANCLSLDFRFLSEEFPEFRNQKFNDAFITELDNSSWTTSGSTIAAPDNFAFDPSGAVISVNAAGVTSMTAANAAGTTYDGVTPLLTASTSVIPGAHSLFLSIFDQGTCEWIRPSFSTASSSGWSLRGRANLAPPSSRWRRRQTAEWPLRAPPTATRSPSATRVG